MEDYSTIYIDPDEPLNSLLERIQSDSKKRLVIVIHEQSTIFTGQVNLELMKTYAQRAGKELIFITKIKKIRNLLSRMEFDVYSQLEDLENKDLEEVVSNEHSSFNEISRSKSKRGLGKMIVIMLSFLLLGGLAWFYFAFPVITIKVSPIIEDKELVSQINANEELTEIDWEHSEIPLIRKEVNLQEKVEIKTTGRKKIGITSAKGVLALINDGKKAVAIPKGTIVSTRNGTKFRTLDKVVVSEAQVERFVDMVVGMKAGRAEVNIEALKKGISGNVSKGRVVRFINKSYPVKIVNPEPTIGGKDKLVNVVTNEDIKEAIKRGKERLKVKAKERLKGEFESNLLFLQDKVKFDEQIFKPEDEAGEVVDRLTVVAKTKVTGFGVEKEGLKRLIFKLYQESLEDGFKLKGEKITTDEIKIKEIRDGEASFSVKSVGKVVGTLDQENLIKQLVGKKIKEVKKLLDQMPQVANYQIKPVNQVNLPEFKFGVKLIITEPMER